METNILVSERMGKEREKDFRIGKMARNMKENE